MDVILNQNERIDELGVGSFRLIQDVAAFCFGVDAVLLSHFADVRKGDRVCDLGCATGIIPVLLAAKTDAAHITGLEIQKSQAALARKNAALNKIEDRFSVVQGDLKDSDALLGRGIFDVVTCNPPYKEGGGGLLSDNEGLRLARHEVACTLGDVIAAAARLLVPGGRFSMIHRPERLCDIMCLMRELKVEPKRMRLVLPRPCAAPTMVLIEGRRGGRPKLSVTAPLFIYDNDGGYSDEIKEIYSGGDKAGY